MPVSLEAWNHMPMQMRSLVTEAGQIDFFRLQNFTYRLLHGKHHRHQAFTLSSLQITHFLGVSVQNHPAKSRVIDIIHPHHTAKFILRIPPSARCSPAVRLSKASVCGRSRNC